jgi:hypothetical protein
MSCFRSSLLSSSSAFSRHSLSSAFSRHSTSSPFSVDCRLHIFRLNLPRSESKLTRDLRGHGAIDFLRNAGRIEFQSKRASFDDSRNLFVRLAWQTDPVE